MQIVGEVKGRTWGESCKIYWKISKAWRKVSEILYILQCFLWRLQKEIYFNGSNLKLLFLVMFPFQSWSCLGPFITFDNNTNFQMCKTSKKIISLWREPDDFAWYGTRKEIEHKDQSTDWLINWSIYTCMHISRKYIHIILKIDFWVLNWNWQGWQDFPSVT